MTHHGLTPIQYASPSLVYSEDPLVNQIVKGHLSQIVQEVRTSVDPSSLLAVACVGGVSRGETAYLHSKGSNEIVILSDYDILVLTKGTPTKSVQQLLIDKSKQLTAVFSRQNPFMTAVHLQPIRQSYLRRIPPSLAFLDAQRSGVVLFSSSREPVFVRSLSPSDIPHSDLLELLLNRLEEYVIVRDSQNLNERLFRLSKLLLDMVTIVRIVQGSFERKYEERVDALFSNKVHSLETRALVPEHYARTLLGYRKSFPANNAEELLALLGQPIDVVDRAILRTAMSLWMDMVMRSSIREISKKDRTFSSFSIDSFREVSREYLIRRLSVHKCAYVTARMALAHQLSICSCARLCLVPEHPKVWLNLSLIAWVSYLLSGNECWLKAAIRYMSILADNHPNKDSYVALLEETWRHANMFIFKP